jgi:hypothetical protein
MDEPLRFADELPPREALLPPELLDATLLLPPPLDA